MSSKDEFLNKFRYNLKTDSKIKNIVAIVSGKGGVGKSLVTSLTSVELRRRGYKVGVLDADITGPSIPHIFGMKTTMMASDDAILPAISRTGIEVVSSNFLLEDPTKPIIWRSPMITSIIKQFYEDVLWGDLDYLLIDLPPGTGDVPLSIFQSLPLTGIVVVTSPQDMVNMIVQKAVNMAETMEIPVLGIVENMSYIVCDNCGHKVYVYGERKDEDRTARLPIDPKIAEKCDHGQIEELVVEEINPLIDSIIKRSCF